MRRSILIVVLLLTLICLAACQTGNSITHVELTEKESMLAYARSDQTFMYDYNVKDDYTSLKVWVEKYENGKKTETIELHRSYNENGIQSKGTIILSTELNEKNDNEATFYSSLFSGGIHSYKEFTSILEGSIMCSSLKNKAKLPTSGKLGLLCIRGNNEGSFDIGQDFFTDYSNNLDAIKDDDIAYLYICEFSKN